MADELVAATVKLTVPFPDPLAGERVIHVAPLVAVHAQIESLAVMLIVPGPPKRLNEPLVGESENEHAMPVCVTKNTFPATLILPVRVVDVGFAATP